MIARTSMYIYLISIFRMKKLLWHYLPFNGFMGKKIRNRQQKHFYFRLYLNLVFEHTSRRARTKRKGLFQSIRPTLTRGGELTPTSKAVRLGKADRGCFTENFWNAGGLRFLYPGIKTFGFGALRNFFSTNNI